MGPPAPDPAARSWAAAPLTQLRLMLDEPPAAGETPPLHDISAAACVGDTLFLGTDEGAHLEILDRDGERFAAHRRVDLHRAFPLPLADDEMDIEGLAVDE